MKIIFLLPLLIVLLSGCTEYAVPQSSLAPEPSSGIVAPVRPEAKQPEAKAPVIAEPKIVIPPAPSEPADVPLSNDNHYINSRGNEVHSPAFAPSRPAGASARCRDGSYSFSQSRRGTCSHHGGVAEWY